MCLCLDMYIMNYAYLNFRVLRLKDMNMCFELHDGWWFKYINIIKKIGWIYFFKILWSLSFIMQWWSLTKLNVVARCFIFNFLHFSLLKHDLFLLFFILICCVSFWWMQGLQFFFISANGFKVYVFCVLSYLLCVALLPNWNQNI
jgi:hypothetical protein